MQKQVKVLVYNNTSISGKAIARFRRGKNRIKPTSLTFNPRRPTLLVNWGFRGVLPANFNNENIEMLNQPTAISLASNKISCLRKLTEENVPTLLYATSLETARGLLTQGSKVYCRKQISSHSGRGIVIASNEAELVEAQLYTKEFKNDIEYRVHVFKGNVIDFQQKKKMSEERRAAKGITEVKSNVRNLMNGWSFVRSELTLKDEDGDYINDLIDVPVAAVEALGLDFAGVDLAYNIESGRVVVIEVNTACGQKPKTSTNFNYIKAIFDAAGDPITLDEYNTRWECELNDFDNGVNELINA